MSSTQTPTRRLVRRTDDRVIAGVAGGLGDYLGIDPVLVRIGFVVLAFAGGSGVIAYLGLWLLTPEVEGGAAPVTNVGDRGPAFWVAVGLFVLAALVIADTVAERSVVWPLVLIGAGIALWRTDGAGRSSAAPRGGAVAPGERARASTTWTAPPTPGAPAGPAAMAAPTTSAAPAPAAPPAASGATAELGTPPGATGQPWAAPPPPSSPTPPASGGGDWTPPPSPDRERSLLGRLTIGVALLAVGVLAVLDAVDVLDATVRDGIAVGLLVVGLGLLVGTWVGRARWLAVVALVFLLPGLVATAVVQELEVPFGAGIGERSYSTTAPGEVAELYELGVGELTLDLGELDLDAPGRDADRVETTARLGVGQLTVVVPDDVAVELTWEVAGGEADLLDTVRSGRAVRGSETFPGEDGAGTLVLDARVALGQLEVVRDADWTGDAPFGESFDGVRIR